MFRKKPLLILGFILVFAFAVRVVGIGYGLPLWLVGDEPPFVTATLKMIELKNPLPTFHLEEFKKILYFPPYISYLYLFPFSVLLGVKYVLFGGTIEAFKNFVTTDLSSFFLLARFINVIIGTLTVFFVYKIGKNIFHNAWVGILTSFFLATSILHINLSSVARDWVPATFMFVLAIFFLTNPSYSLKKRYLLGALISGLAFGISLIGGFIMVFMLLFYLLYERRNILDVFKEKTLYLSLIIFLLFAGISIAFYPFGFHLLGDNSLAVSKSWLGFLERTDAFIRPIILSEPVLAFFAFIGSAAMFKRNRPLFWTVISFILIYLGIFYLMYHYGYRFTIYFFPLLALMAGYGWHAAFILIQSSSLRFALFILLMIPVATSVQFDMLAVKNDSRIQAIRWLEKSLPANSKIIVSARLTRLPTTNEALREQESIDPKSLRQMDRAQLTYNFPLTDQKYFHSLNLYTIINPSFYKNIDAYAKDNNYIYLLEDSLFSKNSNEDNGSLHKYAKQENRMAEFGNPQTSYSIAESNFGNIVQFFKLKSLGPKIEIYKLVYE